MRTALATLKTVALAPIPRPTISVANQVNPASRRRVRRVAQVLPEPVEERRPSLVARTEVEGCSARLEFTLVLAHAWL